MGEQLALVSPSVDPERLLEGLDPEQREVVLHDAGPCLVVAGAGSGKTASTVHRLSYLVAARGISPSRILCLTFTKKAAGEMAQRAARLLGDNRTSVHTFHALCRKILAADWPGFASWSLEGAGDDESEEPTAPRVTYRTLVKEAVGYKHARWKTADVEELMSFVELCKADGARPCTPEALSIARRRYRAKSIPRRDPSKSMDAYEVAETLRQEAFLMTFSDWLVETKELLEKNEDVRSRWAGRFDYVMVDEGQDNCLTQTRIAESLAKDHRNLMLIGDRAQAIHKWRGASPEMFDAFAGEWSARVIRLDRNYRSARSIISLGNEVRMSLAQSDATRLEARGQRDLPGTIRACGFGTQEDEARAIAKSIQEMRKAGSLYKDVFVLYRTNALSRAHEEALSESGVPYVVVGGSSFYSRKEVRALCAYLRLATPRKARLDDLRRSLREPNRFLPRAFLDACEAAARSATSESTWSSIVDVAMKGVTLNAGQSSSVESWKSLIAGLRDRVVCGSAALERIETSKAERAKVSNLIQSETKASHGETCPNCVGYGQNDDGVPCLDCGGTGDCSSDVGFGISRDPASDPDVLAAASARPAELLRTVVKRTNFLEWLEQDEGRDSVENDRRANVAELIRAAESFPTTLALIEHVDHQLSLRSKARKDDWQDRVTLMTFHASKGLESKHVFVSTCNDGVLPHALSEDIEEEKRLFYVATSRARDTMDISWIQMATAVGGQARAMMPSPFIPQRLIDSERDAR